MERKGWVRVTERVGERDTFNVPFLQSDLLWGCGSVHQSRRLSLQRVLVLDVMRAYTYPLFKKLG